MIRATMFFLCLVLAAAAFGRYKAEVAVREERVEIRDLDQRRAAAEAEIQVLRAEIAYLESPERLKKIADVATDLEPLAGDQILSATDFLELISSEGVVMSEAEDEEDADDIEYAIAAAEFGAVKTATVQ